MKKILSIVLYILIVGIVIYFAYSLGINDVQRSNIVWSIVVSLFAVYLLLNIKKYTKDKTLNNKKEVLNIKIIGVVLLLISLYLVYNGLIKKITLIEVNCNNVIHTSGTSKSITKKYSCGEYSFKLLNGSHSGKNDIKNGCDYLFTVGEEDGYIYNYSLIGCKNK